VVQGWGINIRESSADGCGLAAGAGCLERASPNGVPQPTLLLWSLQSPINIGMILRVAEGYGFAVRLLDSHAVLADRTKRETVSDFSCGAFVRRGLSTLKRVDFDGLRRYGRLIATDIEGATASLPEFRYRPGDIFLLGNEYSGLPPDIRAAADEVLSIPMPPAWTPRLEAIRPIDPVRASMVARNGQPSLNVAMTAGILCYAVYTKLLEAADRMEASPALASSCR
jgi:tRNA (cytidine/uridine-2'-O-)-methyltransferase